MRLWKRLGAGYKTSFGRQAEFAAVRPAAPTATAVRFDTNPLFDIATDDRLGGNVNGPSVIRAPSWIRNPLGKYYMYFAHHNGEHIKLAFAEELSGPWSLYEPGALQLSQAPAFRGHIASPDVHVDHERQSIKMYFHGAAKKLKGQRTGLAFSHDGIEFEVIDDLQGYFYFRVFRYRSKYYALAKKNNAGYMVVYRSETGMSDWEYGGAFLPNGRHCAVDLAGDTLSIYFSRVGDAPERILRSTVNLSCDWLAWKPSLPEEVLAPDAKYEGAGFETAPSRNGPAVDVPQLRDPAIFSECGRTFLFYSGKGEGTINGAELIFDDADD